MQGATEDLAVDLEDQLPPPLHTHHNTEKPNAHLAPKNGAFRKDATPRALPPPN